VERSPRRKAAPYGLSKLCHLQLQQQPSNQRAALEIFGDSNRFIEFKGFLRTDFPAFDDDKLDHLLEDLLQLHPDDSEAFRHAFFARIKEAQGSLLTTKTSVLKATTRQKRQLAKQMHALLNYPDEIDGWFQLNSDGKLMSAIPQAKVTGKRFAIKRSHIGSVKPRVPRGPLKRALQDGYQPPSKAVLPDSSIDLVTCEIGLHHCPVTQLPTLIRRIYEMLRPGGSFLLREHDANTLHLKQSADLAHMIVNAGTGVGVELDAQEYRNFQGLHFWIRLLESHGFQHVRDRHVVAGSRTHNTLLRFTKPMSEADRMMALARTDVSYLRAQERTWVTTVKWFDVDLTTAHASFVQQHPSHAFPYCGSAALFWLLFRESARRGGSSHVQNLIRLGLVGAQSLLNTAKGVLALQGGLWGAKGAAASRSDVRQQLIDSAADYARFIGTTPSYRFPYAGHTRLTWRAFGKSWSKSISEKGRLRTLLTGSIWSDFAACIATHLSNGVRGAVGKGLIAYYSRSESAPAKTTGMVLRGNAKELTRLQSLFQAQTGKEFRVRASKDKHHYIQVPRDLPFNVFMNHLANRDLSCLEIAGNKTIQLQVSIADAGQCHGIDGCEIAFTYKIPTEHSGTRVALAVQVERVADVMQILKSRGAYVRRFHDF